MIRAYTTRFQDWMDRPVYKAQCMTSARANKLGIGVAKFPLFRATPQNRDMWAKAARGMVATSIRLDRLAALAKARA